jgi:hypothetical protein
MYLEIEVKDAKQIAGIFDGVRPVVGLKFFRALQAEERGDFVEAEKLLNEAVVALQEEK